MAAQPTRAPTLPEMFPADVQFKPEIPTRHMYIGHVDALQVRKQFAPNALAVNVMRSAFHISAQSHPSARKTPPASDRPLPERPTIHFLSEKLGFIFSF